MVLFEKNGEQYAIVPYIYGGETPQDVKAMPELQDGIRLASEVKGFE